MDEPNSPTITIPLHEFLEILWRSDDRTQIEQPSIIYDTLCQYPNDSIFHLIHDDSSSQFKYATVWRARDWALAYEKYEKGKKQAEERVNEWNFKSEVKNELCVLISTKMGLAGGMEITVAESIMNSGNVTVAEAMGASPDLCQRIQQLKK